MSLSFNVFEETMGGKVFFYGATRAEMRISSTNLKIEGFYKTSRGEIPEHVRYTQNGEYYVVGPRDDFGLLLGNALSHPVCTLETCETADGYVTIEVFVKRTSFKVVSLLLDTNEEDIPDPEQRCNLNEKLACVLINKRYLQSHEGQIAVAVVRKKNGAP